MHLATQDAHLLKYPLYELIVLTVCSGKVRLGKVRLG
jgi:hypothetical protein